MCVLRKMLEGSCEVKMVGVGTSVGYQSYDNVISGM